MTIENPTSDLEVSTEDIESAVEIASAAIADLTAKLTRARSLLHKTAWATNAATIPQKAALMTAYLAEVAAFLEKKS